MPAGPVLSALARGTGLLGFWVIIAGPAASGLPAGALAAALGAWASLRLIPPAPRRWRPIPLLLLLLRFPWQALRAGTEVARLALDPRRPPHPGTIDWAPRLPPGPARDAFLAYASLLPGTLPAGDLPHGHVAIHALDARAPIAAGMVAEEARFARAIGHAG